MNNTSKSVSFWIGWLRFASLMVATFGLFLVLAPSLSRQGFAMLVYFDPQRIDSFGPEAVRYITLAHAVIGSTMVGWGVALFLVNDRLVLRGGKVGLHIIGCSLLSWFVPDTIFSVLTGFWQNALLNLSFAMIFAVPLMALRHVIKSD